MNTRYSSNFLNTKSKNFVNLIDRYAKAKKGKRIFQNCNGRRYFYRCAPGSYVFVDTNVPKTVDNASESDGGRCTKCAVCGSIFLKSKVESANNRGTCYSCHSKIGKKSRQRTSTLYSSLNKYLVVDENKQNYFQCDLCSFSCEPFADVFTHHYNTEHPNDNLFLSYGDDNDPLSKFVRDASGVVSYVCDRCTFSCVPRKTFLKHYAQHGVTLVTNDSETIVFRDNKFLCVICSKSYTSSTYAKRHLRRVHGEKKHKCQVCGKGFAFKHKARVHEQRHLKIKPYRCDKCGRKFVYKKNLDLHASKNLCSKYTCHWCNGTFYTKVVLREHLLACEQIVECPVEAPSTYHCELMWGGYQCATCSQKFTSKGALRAHVIDENNLTPYPCSICSLHFASQRQLTQHKDTCLKSGLDHDFLVVVKSDGTFSCKLCGKNCRKLGYLRQHLKLHSGVKPYVCQFCGKAYALRSSLQSHMLTEMNLRRYACSVCGKRYNTSSHLTAHTKKHHRLREFKCATCDKDFAYLRDLNEHTKTHDEVKPFFCDKCGGFFKTERYLKKHWLKCSALKKK